ncbi:hypothetical protein D1B33_01150 [Lysinibacillus yapensis]|uniref:4-vinyl reductase 4VR domain-containing protein n=1 Tax=Ureibacillus yapensis TaxID=2304605 RepID=A0A396SSQ3_9BACL|nr:XylR N-terminal domain-containing protein [Lysinibacillus yapensis]RHW39481.1 hypothetical protein D1B33_01150 [Lysinibacillus yapensis]
MKANKLVFDHLVDINPRTGVIKFNGKRMGLIATESIGFLRRDLIRILGTERAKSVLMRHGMTSGYSAAQSVKKAFPWRCKEELILAGPALHTLEGLVMVEPSEIQIDGDSLYMQGTWFYSYEYEEHVKHFGFSNESVCWNLVGYVKGFLSNVFGDEVIVYEETCKGKGDYQCTFVACSSHLAPPEHSNSLHHFEEDCLLSEFDEKFHQLEQAQSVIQRADRLNEKLTNALLSEQNLASLLNYMSDELGISVLVERNRIRRPIEFIFKETVHEKIYAAYSNGEQLPEQGFVEVFPIKSEQAYYGKLVLIGQGILKDEERLIAGRCISPFLWYFNTQYKVAERTWRKKVNLFEQIIGGKGNSGTLKLNPNILDVDIHQQNRVLMIKSDIENVYTLYLFIEKLLVTDIFIKENYVVILASELEKPIQQTAEDILNALIEMFPQNSFYIGVGQQGNSLETLATSYEDAMKLCNFLVHCSSKRQQIAYYEQLKHVLLFLKTSEPTQLIVYYQNVIGKLIDHDIHNEAQLLLTLQTFFDCNGNINKTAQQLNLSIPGLRYRMEKIESLVDADLKSGDGRFQCQLALQFYYAVQAIK